MIYCIFIHPIFFFFLFCGGPLNLNGCSLAPGKSLLVTSTFQSPSAFPVTAIAPHWLCFYPPACQNEQWLDRKPVFEGCATSWLQYHERLPYKETVQKKYQTNMSNSSGMDASILFRCQLLKPVSFAFSGLRLSARTVADVALCLSEQLHCSRSVMRMSRDVCVCGGPWCYLTSAVPQKLTIFIVNLYYKKPNQRVGTLLGFLILCAMAEFAWPQTQSLRLQFRVSCVYPANSCCLLHLALELIS